MWAHLSQAPASPEVSSCYRRSQSHGRHAAAARDAPKEQTTTTTKKDKEEMLCLLLPLPCCHLLPKPQLAETPASSALARHPGRHSAQGLILPFRAEGRAGVVLRANRPRSDTKTQVLDHRCLLQHPLGSGCSPCGCCSLWHYPRSPALFKAATLRVSFCKLTLGQTTCHSVPERCCLKASTQPPL